MKGTLVVFKDGMNRWNGGAYYLTIAALLAFCFASASTAQIVPNPILTNQLLAKAVPDECFAGIGQPYPAMLSPGVCPSGSVPKRNQGYVWGLTQSGTKLWFGTAANAFCLVRGQKGNTTPMQNASWVCEFGASQYAKANNLPATAGDWRPPRAFVYDTAGTAGLVDVTPTDSKFAHTLGIRSAGSMGDTVILAGQQLGGQGVNFFAFSSSTQQFIGSCEVTTFTEIRQWRLVNNVLYAGVANRGGGGGVIRWNGTPSQPFDNTSATCGFQVVGNLAGNAAYLTEYGPNSDRIAVSAWPNPRGAGIYISPAMNVTTGLTPSDAGNWTQIWQPSIYEPDPVTALTYAGGAIAYWNGALYFGTMTLVGQGASLHDQVYGQPTTHQQYVNIFQNTYRAISIWQIQNADTTPIIQLLYGESALPKFDPNTSTFQSTPTGFTPLYGPSGFGNIFNNYTWTAHVFQNRLFFGTMDWSYLQTVDGSPLPAPGVVQPPSAYGADLWRFDSPSPATAESINGLGNFLNYGLRSMVVSPDGQELFLGTANPMNLAPQGGWELWQNQVKP